MGGSLHPVHDLAERLRDPGPHPPRGLAMTSLLLEDARGPLSFDSRPAALERAPAALSAFTAAFGRTPVAAHRPRSVS
jgi:hypothetical protein